MSRKCYFAVIISRGSYRSSYASAQLFRVKTYWNSEVKCLVESFLKEVSQKRCVFDLQSFFFEGNLAEKLRF